MLICGVCIYNDRLFFNKVKVPIYWLYLLNKVQGV